MTAPNDYQGGNYIVDCIMETERYSLTNTENAAERGARTLGKLGWDTQFQAELLVRELQREEDLWLRLRTSRVGLPTLFSMGAMIISILAFCIATGASYKDPTAALLFFAVAFLALIVLIYWFLEFHRFNKAARSGDISIIRELHRSLNAWLLLNSDAAEACPKPANKHSENTATETHASTALPLQDNHSSEQ